MHVLEQRRQDTQVGEGTDGTWGPVYHFHLLSEVSQKTSGANYLCGYGHLSVPEFTASPPPATHPLLENLCSSMTSHV